MALDIALRDTEASDWSMIYRAAGPMNGDGGGGVATPWGVGDVGQQALNTALGQQQQTLAGREEQLRHYIGWCYACIRVIGQAIARQKIMLAMLRGTPPRGKRWLRQPFEWQLPRALKSQQENMDVLVAHPLLDTLTYPNELMPDWVLKFVTVAHLEMCGVSYWWMVPTPQSPAGWTIWPLPPNWVTPKYENGQLFSAWEIRPGNATQPVTVPGWQIARIYYPDPSNPLSATGTLQPLARSIVVDEAMREAQRRSFKNGLNPALAITVGKTVGPDGKEGPRIELTQDQRAQLVTRLRALYRGLMNWDEPVILDRFIEKIDPISRSVRDMDFPKGRLISKEEICQGFGVNPIIMGQVEGANRAQSAAAEDHFLNWTVNPKSELLSQFLTMFVAPVFARKGERLLCYLEPSTAYDPDEERSKNEQLMKYGAMTLNDLRAEYHKPPKPGGNIALISNTLVPFDLDGGGYVEPTPPAGGGGAAGGGKPPPAGGGSAAEPTAPTPTEGGGGGKLIPVRPFPLAVR